MKYITYYHTERVTELESPPGESISQDNSQSQVLL